MLIKAILVGVIIILLTVITIACEQMNAVSELGLTIVLWLVGMWYSGFTHFHYRIVAICTCCVV